MLSINLVCHVIMDIILVFKLWLIIFGFPDSIMVTIALNVYVIDNKPYNTYKLFI